MDDPKRTSAVVSARVPKVVSDRITRAAIERGLSRSEWILYAIESALQDKQAYYNQMAARSSFSALIVTLNLLNIADIPQSSKKEILNGISAQVDAFFGRTPKIPDQISEQIRTVDNDFVSKLLAIYEAELLR